MRAKRSLERDIMLGQAEGRRKQGKPRMRWLDSIKEAIGLGLEDLREAVQDRKKWRTLVEEKTRNRGRTNVKWIQEKAMANHSCTAKLAKKILHRITRSLSRLDGLLLLLLLLLCYCECYYCKYWNSTLCRAWLYAKLQVWFINISAGTLSSSVSRRERHTLRHLC